MEINPNAPLAARKEIFITAPIEKVWAIQADIDHWADWQPDVASAKLDGALAAGTGFRWKAAGMQIVSTLHTVEAPRKIGWTGKSLGMQAVHNWTFEPEGSGTRVKTEESLAGWFPSILKVFAPQFLHKSLEKSLRILKERAEHE